MAGREDGLRVVLDASAFVSAALKAGSVPEQGDAWDSLQPCTLSGRRRPERLRPEPAGARER